MSTAHIPVSAIEPADALKLFNEFQAQSRARGEATLKLVMSISGAMLTLTVGAVLNGTPAKVPAELLPSLQIGWGCLFASIALSLILMCSMIIGTFRMGVRWRNAMFPGDAGFVTIATWSWLRVANAVVALAVLLSFLAGLVLVAQVAIGTASSSGGTLAQLPSIPAVAAPLRSRPP